MVDARLELNDFLIYKHNELSNIVIARRGDVYKLYFYQY